MFLIKNSFFHFVFTAVLRHHLTLVYKRGIEIVELVRYSRRHAFAHWRLNSWLLQNSMERKRKSGCYAILINLQTKNEYLKCYGSRSARALGREQVYWEESNQIGRDDGMICNLFHWVYNLCTVRRGQTIG